jgi:uncharacterized membrane protein
MAAANPFDPAIVLFAKHAQHVVLIHFPIALFTVGVTFDLAAEWSRRRGLAAERATALAAAAYYNLLLAAIFAVPAVVTGTLAWQFALEGKALKGILLGHLILGCVSSIVIWISWWTHFRGRKSRGVLSRTRLVVEILGVILVSLTGHLGGFLSGVNGV